MKANIFEQIELTDVENQNSELIYDVNSHVHSPHSYCTFNNIIEAFEMAVNENVKVIGINDFYTIDGYHEFAKLAKRHKIFPLFNIEFICMQPDLVANDICVNHPSLPGRTYITGKGLNHLKPLSYEMERLLGSQIEECNRRASKKILRANEHFEQHGIGLKMDISDVRSKFGGGQIRERHLAEYIRLEIFKKHKNNLERIELLNTVLSSNNLDIDIENFEQIDDLILRKYFITGAVAFEPEDTSTFLSLENIIKLIIELGGIPCYPLLLDTNNKITGFEKDKDKLIDFLHANNIYNVEIIPKRNETNIVEDYANFFHQNNFIVTFGTEHNTKKMEPIKVLSKQGSEMPNDMKKMNYEGAAVIAAHQYLVAGLKEGYCSLGSTQSEKRYDFVRLGKKIIKEFVS